MATAEVPYPADKVYATVLQEAEDSGRGMKIVKRDDEHRLIEISDGDQTASIKVIEEKSGESQIVVTADLVEQEKQKELALQVLLFLCNKYGEECRVKEK